MFRSLLFEMDMSGQLNAPAALPPGERAHGRHTIGGLVGPIAGLDTVVEKIFEFVPGIESRFLNRPRTPVTIEAEMVKLLKVKHTVGWRASQAPSKITIHLRNYTQPPVRRKSQQAKGSLNFIF
jgi:hypothetical protein